MMTVPSGWLIVTMLVQFVAAQLHAVGMTFSIGASLLALCREESLTQLFLASIRRGKEQEVCLAARALGLHIVTLGASTATEAIYQEVRPSLEYGH
jgi:hypothetical protein